MSPRISRADQADLTLNFTDHWVGLVALLIFILAYAFVIVEEFTHLRKSKPVMLAAGLIWAIIAYQYAAESVPHAAEEAVRHFLTEFAELFLFLLTAMTYVNSMSERLVFSALRTWPVSRQLSYRKLFWITGIIAFFLFGCTIATAVGFHNFLHLPPFLGMMTGLAYLQIYGYYLRRTHVPVNNDVYAGGHAGEVTAFDGFREVARAEWDTLLFFFGVIMCVGGLVFIGYLDQLSQYAYTELGPTIANVMVGVVSAIVDNIPVMVAVLQMNPDMDLAQWLLVTLTAGVGGSLLSIGSAAGVALMGQARGQYTFFSHLKWTPAIAAGFAPSIWVHLLVNKGFVNVAPG